MEETETPPQLMESSTPSPPESPSLRVHPGSISYEVGNGIGDNHVMENNVNAGSMPPAEVPAQAQSEPKRIEIVAAEPEPQPAEPAFEPVVVPTPEIATESISKPEQPGEDDELKEELRELNGQLEEQTRLLHELLERQPQPTPEPEPAPEPAPPKLESAATEEPAPAVPAEPAPEVSPPLRAAA